MDENNKIKSKLRYSEEKEEKENETKNEEAKGRFNKSVDIGKDLIKQLPQKTFELFNSMVQQCVENRQV